MLALICSVMPVPQGGHFIAPEDSKSSKLEGNLGDGDQIIMLVACCRTRDTMDENSVHIYDSTAQQPESPAANRKSR